MKKLLIILVLALSGFAASAQTPPFQNYATNGTPYLSKAANYTILAADFANNGELVIYCDATTASFTITLPTVSTMVATGRTYILRVIKTDATANTVTISGTATNINPSTSFVITRQFNGAIVSTNNTQFYAVGTGGDLVDVSTGYVVNLATTGISSATLNSTYANVPIGYRVICPSITLGGAIYVKATEAGSSDVWLMVSAPVAP